MNIMKKFFTRSGASKILSIFLENLQLDYNIHTAFEHPILYDVPIYLIFLFLNKNKLEKKKRFQINQPVQRKTLFQINTNI
jgi:hypothetical protein